MWKLWPSGPQVVGETICTRQYWQCGNAPACRDEKASQHNSKTFQFWVTVPENTWNLPAPKVLKGVTLRLPAFAGHFWTSQLSGHRLCIDAILWRKSPVASLSKLWSLQYLNSTQLIKDKLCKMFIERIQRVTGDAGFGLPRWVSAIVWQHTPNGPNTDPTGTRTPNLGPTSKIGPTWPN